MEPFEQYKQDDPEYQEHLRQQALKYLAEIIVKSYMQENGLEEHRKIK